MSKKRLRNHRVTALFISAVIMIAFTAITILVFNGEPLSPTNMILTLAFGTWLFEEELRIDEHNSEIDKAEAEADKARQALQDADE